MTNATQFCVASPHITQYSASSKEAATTFTKEWFLGEPFTGQSHEPNLPQLMFSTTATQLWPTLTLQNTIHTNYASVAVRGVWTEMCTNALPEVIMGEE